MAHRITIVDYGLGNINAFTNIFMRLNICSHIARTGAELYSAEKIVLPGVGAFDWAMNRLNESGMRGALDEVVLRHKVPVLGVCVGMQIMAGTSDEGKTKGLAWIDAQVKRLDNLSIRGDYFEKCSLPHMGWNDAIPTSVECLFKGISLPQFYFLHSYYFKTENSKHVLATTNYGENFPSAVRRENIFGVQFHPEKSHHWGIQLLKNFAEL